MEQASPVSGLKLSLKMIQDSYENAGLSDFESFLESETFTFFREKGLLII